MEQRGAVGSRQRMRQSGVAARSRIERRGAVDRTVSTSAPTCDAPLPRCWCAVTAHRDPAVGDELEDDPGGGPRRHAGRARAAGDTAAPDRRSRSRRCRRPRRLPGLQRLRDAGAHLPSERIVVHYVVLEINAPPLNDDDADGAPDYVENVGSAADRALAYYERRGLPPRRREPPRPRPTSTSSPLRRSASPPRLRKLHVRSITIIARRRRVPHPGRWGGPPERASRRPTDSGDGDDDV